MYCVFAGIIFLKKKAIKYFWPKLNLVTKLLKFVIEVSWHSASSIM